MPEDVRMHQRIGDAFAPATVEPPTVGRTIITTFRELTMPDGAVLVDIVCGELSESVTGMRAVRIRNELRQLRAAIVPPKQKQVENGTS